jgi:hypothetical protein
MQPLWKSAWRFFNKLKIELPYDPATLLAIYPKECTSAYYSHTIFIKVLFTTARLWNQPIYPPKDL